MNLVRLDLISKLQYIISFLNMQSCQTKKDYILSAFRQVTAEASALNQSKVHAVRKPKGFRGTLNDKDYCMSHPFLLYLVNENKEIWRETLRWERNYLAQKNRTHDLVQYLRTIRMNINDIIEENDELHQRLEAANQIIDNFSHDNIHLLEQIQTLRNMIESDTELSDNLLSQE